MAQTLSTANQAFLPSEAASLVLLPVIAASTATQVCNVAQSNSAGFRVPVITADGSAHWVPETVEIPVSQAALAESVAVFKALKALVPVSNEAMADMNPAIATIIGDGLSRDISAQLDLAFFGDAVAGAPVGIKSLTTSEVSAGGAWANADPFLEAIYNTEAIGATVTSFVANPADALALAQIKEATGSARSLLEPGPTAVGRRIVSGVQLYVSPAVAVGEIWAIPRDRVIVVIRSNVDIRIDESAAFSSDQTLIRAVLRAGWVFPHPLAITKITKA